MVLFRTDGNERVSTGHVMRCLSLADAYPCRIMVNYNAFHFIVGAIMKVSDCWKKILWETDRLAELLQELLSGQK